MEEEQIGGGDRGAEEKGVEERRVGKLWPGLKINNNKVIDR